MQLLGGGKKDALARLAARSGMLGVLERIAKKDCLVVLCYHRIGNPEASLYDPALFSATAEQFDDQVAVLRRRYQIAQLEEAIDFVDHPSRLRGAHILITFDDGYLDNCSVAAPILQSHGAQGTFFLATSFIASATLPWWDQMAGLLRQTTRTEIVLDYPRPVRLPNTPQTFRATLKSILSLYKSADTTDAPRFVAQLEEACGSALPTRAATREFMNWDEASSMLRMGMAIASHTHHHPLLGKLSFEQQLSELTASRQLLRERLGVAGDVLAYPVGSRASFSETTRRALSEAGYRGAFSFYGGVNVPGRLERFDLQRLAVGSEISMPHFRMRVAAAATATIQY